MKMKMFKVLAAVAVLTLGGVGMSYADDAPTTATKPAETKLHGAIKEIGTGDTPDITLTIGRPKDAKTQVVSTTADTVVMVGKDKKTLKDLAVGNHVAVTLDANGKAATITVVTMQPRGKGNAAGGGANVPPAPGQ